MDTKVIQQKAEAMRLLADLSEKGAEARQAFAQRMAEPILKAIQEQSSIQEIFVEDPIPAGEQAIYEVDLSLSPQGDPFSGGNPGLVAYEQPGFGPVVRQFTKSTQIIIPPKFYEAEAEFDRTHALHARFSYADRQKALLKQAMLKQIEQSGWNVIQEFVSNSNFPSDQIIEISSGSDGYGRFSRQLFDEMVATALQIGLIENPEYKLYMYLSVQSFKEFTQWDIATTIYVNATDIRPTSLSELEKQQIAKIDPRGYVAEYRGVRIKALRRLQTGDVWDGYDAVYLFVVSPRPEFFARPVFPAPNGERVEMIDDPIAPYRENKIRTKMRYSENYAILDARAVVVGRIARS